MFAPVLLGSLLIAGCDSLSIIDSEPDDDLYELELDDETGPIDDGLSGNESMDFIPGDFEIDGNGVAVLEPQIGAALPDNAIRKQEGAWTRVFNWPISPIHMALLPDSSILSYGTNPDGENGTGFTFDKWYRWLGKGASSHETMPTGIETNLFCSAQTLMPDGNMLISGGDGKQLDDDSRSLDGVDATTFFDYRSNVLSNGPAMLFPRWYPTLVTMPDGKQLVLGGRENKPDKAIPPVPEIFDPQTGRWGVLNGATNQAFFNNVWFYPRSWLRHNGNVVVIDARKDRVYELSVYGNGSLTQLGEFKGAFGNQLTPSAMFAPGKILFVGKDRRADVLDINGNKVSVTQTDSSIVSRKHGNATVLANGEVFLSGGIDTGAATNSGDYPGEIWNPETGKWTATAMAQKARLYHSTAMLMPNGRVLVAGGGPPGPVVNMNAEIFIPPYLFDANGKIAKRPTLNSMGDVDYGVRFNARVNSDISRVTFVRAGSVTHSFDQGQRFMELDFTQDGNVLDITAPANTNIAPPGLYLLFVFNQDGVPSHAELVMMGEGRNMIGFAGSDF